MTLIELARKLRPFIEKAAMYLDDEDALEAIQLFPHWTENTGYFIDDKVQYEDTLYRCLQNHTSQAGWTHIAAGSLWANVLIPDEEAIPEWEQPGSTNGYQIGDRVRYNDKVYESTIANNIWSPAAYPAGWQEINI